MVFVIVYEFLALFWCWQKKKTVEFSFQLFIILFRYKLSLRSQDTDNGIPRRVAKPTTWRPAWRQLQQQRLPPCVPLVLPSS